MATRVSADYKEGMGNEVEVELVRLVFCEHPDRPQQVHLQEKGGERGFPIMIGINEAAEIHRKLMGHRVERPLTHDLLGQVLSVTGSEVDRVVVSELRNRTFYAVVHVRLVSGEIAEVDSRPSDALAIASQVECPIFVDEGVFAALSPE